MSFIERPRRVSVAMGIYNCAKTLGESIDSLLSQTYKDWELVLCDDASTDNTLEVAEKYAEKYDNIKIIRNKTNIGLAATLNRCIEHASENCEFIARQDGDDLSEPDRFAIQIDFLDNHPEYVLVSTAMSCFDESGIWGIQQKPEKPQPKDFAPSSPFCHAPVMMRRKELAQVGNYTVNKFLRRGQDYYLWHKFYCEGFRGYNIQEPLYRMRDDRAAATRRRFKDRLYGAKIHLEVMQNLKLPFWNYPRVFRGLLIGFVPKPIYQLLHRRTINKQN